ncbi:MAG TPA: 3-hexulose-6-phosphate synthase [Anaeromyxobacter sp.]|nr:3-hexulose-6-phosphate synthase [Anaeromyxobacter sp.]
MRLQLAIDTLTLAEAEGLVARVGDLVDVVEVGTPLIIREGVGAVRRLRAAFPDAVLLADLKIADGGHLEAALGLDAGARIVTVLAAAADATIREVVRAARERGGEVMVDLMGVEDLARRAREVDALGADYVCLHTAVDVQAGHADLAGATLQGLRRVKAALDTARTAVAGGITLASCPAVAALAPDVVVVGSALTGAADPRAAAAAIRGALRRQGDGGRAP